jgi:hypothetical protein
MCSDGNATEDPRGVTCERCLDLMKRAQLQHRIGGAPLKTSWPPAIATTADYTVIGQARLYSPAFGFVQRSFNAFSRLVSTTGPNYCGMTG